MRRKRKTATERRQESYEAERQAWDFFLPKLRAVSSMEDALRLHAEHVGHESPGRKYYANFGFFMHYFAAPDGANLTELTEYLRLVDVFDAEGVLKPGARDQIKKAFELAMTMKPRW